MVFSIRVWVRLNSSLCGCVFWWSVFVLSSLSMIFLVPWVISFSSIIYATIYIPGNIIRVLFISAFVIHIRRVWVVLIIDWRGMLLIVFVAVIACFALTSVLLYVMGLLNTTICILLLLIWILVKLLMLLHLMVLSLIHLWCITFFLPRTEIVGDQCYIMNCSVLELSGYWRQLLVNIVHVSTTSSLTGSIHVSSTAYGSMWSLRRPGDVALVCEMRLTQISLVMLLIGSCCWTSLFPLWNVGLCLSDAALTVRLVYWL